jgi:DNA polymerase-4
LKGRTVQLKVRYADFHTVTRAHTLPQLTDVTQEIWQTAAGLFATKLPARRLQVRLLGVGLSGLDRPAAVQLSLFPDPQHEQQTRLDEVSDRIREKFGGGSLQRALGMLHDVEGRAGRTGPNRDQYGR